MKAGKEDEWRRNAGPGNGREGSTSDFIEETSDNGEVEPIGYADHPVAFSGQFF